MTKNKIQSNSADETRKRAEELVASFRGGEILALSGDLGAGKTTFSQGIAKGLGVSANVNSPTFVIMKQYKCKHPKIKILIHIDAYRLSQGSELETIGAMEFFDRNDAIMLIEWPENIKDILPKKTKFIYFKQEREKRIITFK